ncbi:hypothetical protein [Bacillus sp. AFS017336]|uniref:hypothetical protein n=1 Tax=Bacillus sp. AFS017336 TaxID=2033489 RepID=UPI000BF0A037|nr:hypothetical protein [Bacillus sp. AFS017336]PEL08323.1 hypothetical protein CN601_17040 [Bacillus sp. AFS017336]
MKKKIISRKKERYLFIIILLALVVTLIPNKSNAENIDSTNTLIKVLFRQTYAVNWNEVSEIEKDKTINLFVNGNTGWSYNPDEEVFERFVSLENIEVTLENSEESKTTNTNGEVVLNGEGKQLVNISMEGIDDNLSQIVDFSQNEVNIIKEMDISQMLKDSEKDLYTEKPSSTSNTRASSTDPYWEIGEEGHYGDRLHCNRFNGPAGNGKYYPNYYPQAAINFIMSDCDYSLGRSKRCLADYTSDKYCAASPSSKQGKCSTFIGHYNRFHNH